MKLETYINIKLTEDLKDVYRDIYTDENEDEDIRKTYRNLYNELKSRNFSLEEILNMQLEYADVYDIAEFIKHYTVAFLRWGYLIECNDFRELERCFDDEALDYINKEIKEYMESTVETSDYSTVINWYVGNMSTDDFIADFVWYPFEEDATVIYNGETI